MAAVYVISASGKPLMPTTRCGHIRGLLNAGKARVVEREPFTRVRRKAPAFRHGDIRRSKLHRKCGFR